MKIKSSRELAFVAYTRIIQDQAYSNLVLNQLLGKTDLLAQDKALASRITYGTLQWQGLIDYYLKTLSHRPLSKLSNKALFLLRMGAYQILFLDRVPPSASVNETVKVAHRRTHKGIANFVNGILRNLIRKKDQILLPSRDQDLLNYLSVKYSHPYWMVKLWYDKYGLDKTISIMDQNNSTPEEAIRVNKLLTSLENLKNELEMTGIQSRLSSKIDDALLVDNLGDLNNNTLFNCGYFQVQDINSMVVSHLCDPQQGDNIIDLCSAPGSKTTHLVQLIDGQGSILAVDIHEHRLKLVKEACRRLQVNNVNVKQADGTKLISRDQQENNKQLKGQFDLCLIDAPCSGLGTLRKRPELKWTISEQDLNSLSTLQGKLLKAGSQLVKPGGTLVYSTCTINPQENEDQINDFLKNHPDFVMESPRAILKEDTLQGGMILSNNSLQYFPELNLGDGFYGARMKKTQCE
ncbi:16S rRNA (cytosine(967)-C(5))-methyltransferase RsmB [Natranaerobius thermophilus]|uniref:16S rRNA (cytosine(967)-C(5))-methyltransferase n=1 Tax=Natranaerobius thermophilus (strain ATCC BAA-1301 / DSM 18059 / JW/NM-WN-LF) TaxID=457570 RepID=B2A2K5_NATTJ|nr:16S rRNA (cytosine(967)-C(5))-methyltransferase RsmB [Natranaerobius thermophilus]ACB84920.1 sun protein [Natranaerobius thermophilus JW/NM-WN-LF]